MTASNVVFRHVDLVGVQEHNMAANQLPGQLKSPILMINEISVGLS
ncbi:hypothetical protein QG37_06476 [Candidozyma auris]|uniref:Uncharacterized protein n=1 Tax=Candidozyma auris TaxID=498019 RepID=A0A0L0NSV6_CANAR|nr:hypothetical protein QG37_06476 [[Candida] auris]